MKIWVDDLRPTPEGYVGFDTTNGALRFIVTHIDEVEVIDLDHDMGGNFGGDCINIMTELERICHSSAPKWEGYKEHIEKIKFRLHSANPVGVQNMRAVIERNGWIEIF